MEEQVYKLVENTFKNNSFEKAKVIIANRILWYEMKLKELQDIIDQDDDEGEF